MTIITVRMNLHLSSLAKRFHASLHFEDLDCKTVERFVLMWPIVIRKERHKYADNEERIACRAIFCH